MSRKRKKRKAKRAKPRDVAASTVASAELEIAPEVELLASARDVLGDVPATVLLELLRTVRAVVDADIPTSTLLEVVRSLTPKVLGLLDAVDLAVGEHRELLEVRDGDYGTLRRQHLAAELVWTLRAALCFERGDHDAARKAATTGNEHARQAARLERDSLADRVAALETEVQRRRSIGRELEDLGNDVGDDA